MAQEVKQAGLRFVAQTPRVVAEGVGFCWYPSIRQFSSGELMISYSLNPDSGENLVNVTGVSLSRDNGATWARHCDVTGLSGRLDISLPDGALAGPNQPYKPESSWAMAHLRGQLWPLREGRSTVHRGTVGRTHRGAAARCEPARRAEPDALGRNLALSRHS